MAASSLRARRRARRKVQALEDHLEQLGRDKAALGVLRAAHERLSMMVDSDASVDDLRAVIRATVLPLDLSRCGVPIVAFQRGLIEAAGLDRPDRLLPLDGTAQVRALEEVLSGGC